MFYDRLMARFCVKYAFDMQLRLTAGGTAVVFSLKLITRDGIVRQPVARRKPTP